MMEAVLYFDGSCSPNPGEATIGFTIRSTQGTCLAECARAIGPGTSNIAELSALVVGLAAALEMGIRKLRIVGDSMLTVQMVGGQWRTRKPHLRTLCEQARELLRGFDSFTLEHIPREQNTRADELTRIARNAA